MKAIAKKESTSETGFYKLFEWPVNPKKSIEMIIQENDFKFPIEFYYGSVDWMDRKGALRLAQSQKNVTCETIKDAGHQIIFDNPLGVVNRILREDRIDKEESFEERMFKNL